MTVIELVIAHIGFIAWFICGYQIAKSKYNKTFK